MADITPQLETELHRAMSGNLLEKVRRGELDVGQSLARDALAMAEGQERGLVIAEALKVLAGVWDAPSS
ncbi:MULTISPECIES: hypothetical protein [Halomonas]|uniref:hypothetical protein n=1 Tax=Halomonas TaxID=2745 RepID=UPI00105BFD9D|nr:hypothetical protein [Halomonas ventosae]